MNCQKTLETLCRAFGVNGYPQIAAVAKDLLGVYTNDIITDALGNVIAKIGNDPSKPTVMLEAHMDEIGFMVTGIDENGFLKVAHCGRVDERVLSAAEVVVLTDPLLAGVFCSVPPHLAKANDPSPALEDRGIDIGLTHDEAAARVPFGTKVAFHPHFDALPNGRVCSKSLDDRAGMTAILWALECVKGKDLPVNITVVFATQEELGCRGAKGAAFALQPAAALVTDVSFAYTPDARREECGELGKGVMLGYSPLLSTALTDHLCQLAKQNTIPLQREVMGGSTGTDADAICAAGIGIPTALLSIPERYMHTPVEVVSLADVQAVGELMAAFLESGVC